MNFLITRKEEEEWVIPIEVSMEDCTVLDEKELDWNMISHLIDLEANIYLDDSVQGTTDILLLRLFSKVKDVDKNGNII